MTTRDGTDEVFFLWSDYQDVLEKIKYQHENPPANYFKKTGIAPDAFRDLCIVIDAMLEGHDPITEADNVLGGVDYSRNFRYEVSTEFAQKLIFNGRRDEERVSGRISDVDALFSAHVPIKKIQKMRKKYYVMTRVCLASAFAAYAVPLLLEPERIKDEYEDYVGLTELQIGSFSVMKLSDRLHTQYVCIMYGGHYRNGHGVMTHVALALGAAHIEDLRQFLEDLLPGIKFEFIA